jgi:hypothetical protein
LALTIPLLTSQQSPLAQPQVVLKSAQQSPAPVHTESQKHCPLSDLPLHAPAQFPGSAVVLQVGMTLVPLAVHVLPLAQVCKVFQAPTA